MKITIYQMISEADNASLIFMDLHYVQTACGGQVPAQLYQAVYSGDMEIRSLEDAFYIFNMERPEGYSGRSMSVSDVIEVYDPDTGSEFYYCEPVGFQKIVFDKGKINKSDLVRDRLHTDIAERQGQ